MSDEVGSSTWNYIVVGAGAAGCVLASRLSEDSDCSVLLLEAGRDTPPGAVPADIVDTYPVSYSNPDYFWSGLRAAGTGNTVPFLQPRVMGGGSSVMGMWALRGVPDDYDSWQAQGARGWGWADVLPYFNKIETDLDFSGPMHGRNGPIPVRRTFADSWPGFARAFLSANEQSGLPYREDLNGDFEDGIFPVPIANRPQGRVTTASAYLDTKVRQRSNLKILTDTLVSSIVIRDSRAVGVQVIRVGLDHAQFIRGHEVIVSGGGVQSPALLLRSGVGPAEDLQRVGVQVVADLPVGRHLQNHCLVNFAMPLQRASRQEKALRTYGLACARASSGVEQGKGDLHFQFIAKSGPNAHGDRLGILGAALYAPLSEGSVTLVNSDPIAPPCVDFRLLSHPTDQLRMRAALQLALRMLSHPTVTAIRGDVLSIAPSSIARRLNRPGVLNCAMSHGLAMLLDSPWPISLIWRRAGHPVDVLDNSDAAIDFLCSQATPVFHPTGSCRMGSKEDPNTVVDPFCRVKDVENLRVIDASIMPSIPRANTCLPTIMIAERAVDLIKSRGPL